MKEEGRRLRVREDVTAELAVRVAWLLARRGQPLGTGRGDETSLP